MFEPLAPRSVVDQLHGAYLFRQIKEIVLHRQALVGVVCYISVFIMAVEGVTACPGLEAVWPAVYWGGVYDLVEPAARRVINEAQVIDRFRLKAIYAGYHAQAFDGSDVAHRVVAKAGGGILVGLYSQDALAGASVQVSVRGAGYPVERIVAVGIVLAQVREVAFFGGRAAVAYVAGRLGSRCLWGRNLFFQGDFF